jgi:transposase
LGGKKTGKNPTDRAKGGVKRSVLVEATGVPVGIAVDGANRNDMKMVQETLESIPVERPEPTPKQPQGLCMDKGYDYDDVRQLVEEFGFTAHIRSRGEEMKAIKRKARTKARRWVVERTHSWMNRFRGILIRWNKKPQNYIAMLHFAFAIITYRCAGLTG